MPSTIDHAKQLRALPSNQWEAYLLANSGLPGPRANLALAQTVADLGDEALFRRLIKHDAATAPTNSPAEFLALCGTIGFGRLLVEHHPTALDTLRQQANDSRWRIREGVAIAFQRLGDHNFADLINFMEGWAKGTPSTRRRRCPLRTALAQGYGAGRSPAGHPRYHHRQHPQRHQPQGRGLPRPPQRSRLLLECRRCSPPRRGQTSHGKVAGLIRQRHTVADARKPEERPPQAYGHGVGRKVYLNSTNENLCCF